MIRQSMIKMYVKVVKILLYPNWQLSFSLVSRVRKFYLSVDEKYRQCTGCGMSWFQALGRKLSLAVMKQQSYSCLANNGKRAKWREVFYQSEKDTWGHHTMINNWNPHLKLIIGLTFHQSLPQAWLRHLHVINAACISLSCLLQRRSCFA